MTIEYLNGTQVPYQGVIRNYKVVSDLPDSKLRSAINKELNLNQDPDWYETQIKSLNKTDKPQTWSLVVIRPYTD